MTDLSEEAMRAEIDADRRGERKVVTQALVALLVVLAFVAVRVALVGWGV